MKKLMLIGCFLLALIMVTSPLYAANAPSPGPAPSAGDGVSEGSEWGGLGDMLCDVFPDLCQGVGPAPNAGDGVPDGSGF